MSLKTKFYKKSFGFTTNPYLTYLLIYLICLSPGNPYSMFILNIKVEIQYNLQYK